MKKSLIVGLLTVAITGLTVHAQEAESGKSKRTPEQAAQRQALIEKYDTNKDGKLSKDERAAMSKEDKQALAKTGGVGKAGQGEKKAKKEKDQGDE